MARIAAATVARPPGRPPLTLTLCRRATARSTSARTAPSIRDTRRFCRFGEFLTRQPTCARLYWKCRSWSRRGPRSAAPAPSSGMAERLLCTLLPPDGAGREGCAEGAGPTGRVASSEPPAPEEKEHVCVCSGRSSCFIVFAPVDPLHSTSPYGGMIPLCSSGWSLPSRAEADSEETCLRRWRASRAPSGVANVADWGSTATGRGFSGAYRAVSSAASLRPIANPLRRCAAEEG
jgi:hypothetical protein